MNPYFTLLKQLLPSGRIWNVDPKSKFEGLIKACSQEFYRIGERIKTIQRELDPDQIDESLTDWERALEIKPKGTIENRKKLISWILKNDYTSSAASIMKASADLGIFINISNFDTTRRVNAADFEKTLVLTCDMKQFGPVLFVDDMKAEVERKVMSITRPLLPMYTKVILRFIDV